jgi:nucleotide-binding universal stress UspA family protein
MAGKQHVLVPIDFSENSVGGVRTAGEIAVDGTEITLLHVYDPEHLKDSATVDITPARKGLPPEVEKRETAKLQRIREKELAKHGKVNLEIVVSRFPAEAIGEYAKNNQVDLIALTTHGRSGLTKLLMGSVAEELVRNAPCPVLVLRPHQK